MCHWWSSTDYKTIDGSNKGVKSDFPWYRKNLSKDIFLHGLCDGNKACLRTTDTIITEEVI